jgi:DNA-binding NarL/FixJ family response regulator
MARLQREIVAELLSAQKDVEVVASNTPLEAARDAAAHSRAHVVILGNDDPRAVRSLLEGLPRLLVLTVADQELVAWRYGLAPYREPLGELSPSTLAGAIRRPEQLPRWWID